MYALLLFLLGCNNKPPSAPQEGHLAPEIVSAQIGGEPFELSDLRGQPVMLVFWASWCGPCRRETPEVAKIAAGYGERLHVIGVNAGEDAATAARAAASMQITWPVVLDPNGAIQTSYDVTAIPLVVIIDAQGVIRYRGNGLPTDAHRVLDGLTG